MRRSFFIPLLALAACGAPTRDAAPPGSVPAGPAPATAPTEGDGADPGPPTVILFIGDGTGLDYWSAAMLTADEPLAIESFPVVGLVDTQASNSRVTDSGAGATAFASGIRTFNGAIGVAPDSSPVPTVLEVAESKGWATGLVATSTIIHATPAAFAAHVPSRGMFLDIAEQMAAQDIDVLLGGGRRYFSADARGEGGDLLEAMTRNAAYAADAATFRSLDMDTVHTLIGLFTDGQPEPAPGREPDLAELTRGALQVLEKDQDGFFLMVEGSQIDWRGHDNAPLSEVLAEVRDLDRAIHEALRFQQRRPNTLVIVTADHSTGGMTLSYGDGPGGLEARYTTEGHTGGMVPLFARGPHAAAFGGMIDNDEVGRLLLRLVQDGGTEVSREQ